MKNFVLTILVVGLAVFSAACSMKKESAHDTPANDTAHSSSHDSEFGEVGFRELNEIIAAKSATIIDVNSPKTYQAGHVPGAINFYANQEKLASMLPENKDALIIAYCGSATCSAWMDGANAAKALGYTNIKHYKDGIKGWKQKGGDLA